MYTNCISRNTYTINQKEIKMNNENDITIEKIETNQSDNIEYCKNSDSYGYKIELLLNKVACELWQATFTKNLTTIGQESLFADVEDGYKVFMKFDRHSQTITLSGATIEQVKEIYIDEIKEAMKTANLVVAEKRTKDNVCPVGEKGQLEHVAKIAATIDLSLDSSDAKVLANA